MNTGDLRNKIVIQQQANTSRMDEAGVSHEVWEDVLTTWCSLEDLRNRVTYPMNQVVFELSKRIKVRYTPVIKELMRAKIGELLFDIFAINDPNLKHAELQLMCGVVIPLDKICTVSRIGTQKDTLGRPSSNAGPIGKYPCTFVKSSLGYTQGSPNAVYTASLLLYGESTMDIKAGDSVEIDGVNYTASVPYPPRNHHTEVEITIRKDA